METKPLSSELETNGVPGRKDRQNPNSFVIVCRCLQTLGEGGKGLENLLIVTLHSPQLSEGTVTECSV